jgi:hypothetical protein
VTDEDLIKWRLRELEAKVIKLDDKVSENAKGIAKIFHTVTISGVLIGLLLTLLNIFW